MRRYEIPPAIVPADAKKNLRTLLDTLVADTRQTIYKIQKNSGVRFDAARDMSASSLLRILSAMGGRVVVEMPSEALPELHALEEAQKEAARKEAAKLLESHRRSGARYRLRQQGIRVECDTVYISPRDNLNALRIANIIRHGFRVVVVDENGNPVADKECDIPPEERTRPKAQNGMGQLKRIAD